MSEKSIRSVLSHSIVAIMGFAASVMMSAKADDAVWHGGATGDINVGPWRNTDDTADADITADILNFPCDATVTQTVDTVVYNPFGSKQTQSAYRNRNIVFDMCGHTLWATRDYNGAHNIQGNQGTSFTFTNGTFRAAGENDYATTNTVTTAGNTDSMSIIAVGSDTTLVSSFCLGHKTGLHVLNGAKVYGTVFYFTAASATNELSNGSELQFSTYFDVGTRAHNYGSYAYAYNDVKFIIDNAVLTSADPASGGVVSVNWGCKSYNNELIATNGATVAAKTIYVGSGNSSYTSSNGTFKVTGDGTSVTAADSLYCGHEVTSGNTFLLEDGAELVVTNLYVGYASASNNTAIARGEGTKISAGTISVGGAESSHNPCANALVLDEGVVADSRMFFVNTAGAGNTASIRSGAKVTVMYDVLLGGRRMQDGHKYANYYGESGRLEVVGSGSGLTCGRTFMLRNGTDDPTKGQEFFVGDGADLTLPATFMIGDGNRIVISNAAVTLTGAFLPNGTHITSGTTVAYPATNSVVRLEGASAKFTMPRVQNLDAENNSLVGAPILEFAIPEGGWSTAPFVVNQAFAISDDTTISIDEDSASAYARQGGGTVPLICTDSSSHLITADLSKIGSSLPEGCSLVNESGVLSVKISKLGLILIVR